VNQGGVMSSIAARLPRVETFYDNLRFSHQLYFDLCYFLSYVHGFTRVGVLLIVLSPLIADNKLICDTNVHSLQNRSLNG